MGILDSLRLYRGKWEESGRSAFSADDINAVSSAKVVASDFGHSVCFVEFGKTDYALNIVHPPVYEDEEEYLDE